MQRTKTREEILAQPYLTKADIKKLLQVSQGKAVRIYGFAETIDNEFFKEFRIEPTKVRITSVCKVAGISLNTLQKQIKSASSRKEQSA